MGMSKEVQGYWINILPIHRPPVNRHSSSKWRQEVKVLSHRDKAGLKCGDLYP